MHAPRKQVIAITPQSVTNGATATGNIDTRGFRYLELDIFMATQDVASNVPSVLKLSESDTTDATNFSDISGARGGTDFTQTGSTAAAYGYKFCLDLRGRKRYIKATISPRTTQVLAAVANLGKGEEAPRNASTANVMNLITI